MGGLGVSALLRVLTTMLGVLEFYGPSEVPASRTPDMSEQKAS